MRKLALDGIGDRHDRCLCHLRDGERCGFDLLASQAVSGDVDHVVDPAEYPVIAIGRLHGPVVRAIGPVAPILAVSALAVACVVLLHKTVGDAPDGLGNPGPRIADADIAGPARALGYLLAFGVVDYVL